MFSCLVSFPPFKYLLCSCSSTQLLHEIQRMIMIGWKRPSRSSHKCLCILRVYLHIYMYYISLYVFALQQGNKENRENEVLHPVSKGENFQCEVHSYCSVCGDQAFTFSLLHFFFFFWSYVNKTRKKGEEGEDVEAGQR